MSFLQPLCHIIFHFYLESYFFSSVSKSKIDLLSQCVKIFSWCKLVSLAGSIIAISLLILIFRFNKNVYQYFVEIVQKYIKFSHITIQRNLLMFTLNSMHDFMDCFRTVVRLMLNVMEDGRVNVYFVKETQLKECQIDASTCFRINQ